MMDLQSVIAAHRPRVAGAAAVVRDPGRVESRAMPSAVAAVGAVHDLGNLIQVALSAVTLASRSRGSAGGRAGAMLERALISLEQAGTLVRQTIGVMRDRSGLVAEVAVGDCLADVAALTDALGEGGLALSLEIDPDLPRVRCEAQALRNAILNLVFNARDAMAGGGVVVIEARRRRVRGAAFAAIRVSDTGVGMNAETIARAFDPFFTTKSDGLGGIGLPMVERFVTEAGGTIAVRSEPGVGTAITLLLPAIGAADETEGEPT